MLTQFGFGFLDMVSPTVSESVTRQYVVTYGPNLGIDILPLI